MKTFRLLLSKGVIAACGMFLLFTGSALADSLSFVGGGTATGTFDLDTNTDTVTSIDISVTPQSNGSFGSRTYTYPDSGDSDAAVLTDANGDEVISIDEAFDGTSSGLGNPGTDELDIVIACDGVADCLTDATPGTSFAIATSETCPPPGSGLCIASQEALGVPESLLGRGFEPGYVTVSDPDGVLAFALATTPIGTVWDGSGGGGTNTTAPEPSALLMLTSGLVGLGLLKRKIAVAS
jgi:hypothetical protein